MTQKEKYRNRLAYEIFRVNYDKCKKESARKEFVDYHLREFMQYKQNVAAKAKKILITKRLNGRQYEIIWKWYTMRVPLHLVLKGLRKGVSWVKDYTIPICSINLFRKFVFGSDFLKKQEEIKQKLFDYSMWFEGIYYKKLIQDTWRYFFFKEFYLEYHDDFFFDPYEGYERRHIIFLEKTPIWGRYQMIAEGHRELFRFAKLLGVEKKDFSGALIPSFFITAQKYRKALRLGARKAGKYQKKIKEITDFYVEYYNEQDYSEFLEELQ